MPLLFHQAALGDWILTFPLLRRLAGPVTVVAPGSHAQLAAAMFDHLTPLDIEHADFSHLHAPVGADRISLQTRDTLARADTIITFVSDGHDTWATNVRQLAPDTPCFFVAPRPPADWAGHICQWHERQLTDQGLPLVEGPCQPQRVHRQAGLVVVHPGSGGVAKCWPPERFATLITTLRGAGHPVRVVLGEVELDRWAGQVLDRWQSQHQAEVFTSLPRLHALLSSTRLYIGNDSGPTHLAAQLGVPTVALFGPTAPQRWAPQGPAVTVLAPPTPQPMTWLDPSVVLAACGLTG